MFTPPNIDAEGRTFEELLRFLAEFGSRYRLWKGKNSKAPLTPQAVLSCFDAWDPALTQKCEVQPEKAVIGKRELEGWRVSFHAKSASRSRVQQAQKRSAYVIEDLLDIWRVRAWLDQQAPEKIVAVLPHDGRLSTFLQIYYLEVLGSIPESLEMARLPLWCVYLEECIYGLNPNHRLPFVEICAENASAWLATISALWIEMQQVPGLDLNDGEFGWREEPFAEINAQLRCDPVTLPYSKSQVRAGEGLFTLLCHKGTLTITYSGDLVLDGPDLLLLDERGTCISRGKCVQGKALLTPPREKGGYIIQLAVASA